LNPTGRKRVFLLQRDKLLPLSSLLSKILAVWWIQEAGLAHGSTYMGA